MADHTLDIRRSGSQFTVEGLHVGDRGLRVFNFHFCDGQKAFPLPDGCIATLYARLPDGNNTTVFTLCEIIDSSVVYTLTGAPADGVSVTSFPGRVDCEIRLTTIDNEVLTSPAFSFMIEDTLQDDSAIEAADDFSALTEALGRVLDAEDGLSSKVDRIHGAVGNFPVFGEGGAIADSGISASSLTEIHIFIYDETKKHNDHNRALATQLRSDLENGKKVSVFIDDGYHIYPAAFNLDTNQININSFDNSSGAYNIRFTTNTVTYTYTEIYSSSSSFDESSSKPASQDLTAKWVRQLIDDTIVEGAW